MRCVLPSRSAVFCSVLSLAGASGHSPLPGSFESCLVGMLFLQQREKKVGRAMAAEDMGLLLFLSAASKSRVWAKEEGGSWRFRTENRGKHVVVTISKKNGARTFV